jgi:P-type Mg2+ transporter
MNTTFALPKLRNGNGRSRSLAGEKILAARAAQMARQSLRETFAKLGSSLDGLVELDAVERLAKGGPNEVAHERPPHWLVQLLSCFKNPFIVVLVTLAIIQFISSPDDLRPIIIIGVMVAISVGLQFWQEYRSALAAEKLKALVRTTATVLRRPSEGIPAEPREVPIRELVAGDVVRLSAGDLVPADVRLISSRDLFVSQAALTGEALPVEKCDTLGVVAERSAGRASCEASWQLGDQFELVNVCFLGTNVVSGTATAIVVATGPRTYFGSFARSVAGKRAETSFDRGVKNVSWVLIRFMLVMVPIVLLINLVTKGDWLQSFLFAVSVAVGLTPEMLPMLVSANLAKGALAMARQKVVVKRLNAIQNLGAMDVLCTDKTGTLTQDRIILEHHIDISGKENDKVLELAWLNSHHQSGLKNLLDAAVIKYAAQPAPPRQKKIDELPFDFARRRMSVIVESEDRGHLLICKGAVEETLGVSAYTQERAELVPLDDKRRRALMAMTREYNEDGFRVIALATRAFPPGETKEQYAMGDESALVVQGFLAFLDPPKETAGPAIAALRHHGVAVKILTGDNMVVTRKICREVGLDVGNPVLGRDTENLDDATLRDLVERTTVFAKVSPLQKARIIRMLQANGHTVGFLGDGINDAAALRDADVGISVDTAADIAKESADIILLEKSLLVLENGVVQGRQTFGNIIKYLKMTASSNFGNVFSVLAASTFLPFLPMLPLHLMILDLLYHVSQLSIPWDRLDKDYLLKPRKWEAGDIARFMMFVGPTSSVFDITTFCLMWFVFGANSPEHQSLFQSGWFVESLLSQTLIVHMIRTRKIPFIQSAAAPLVLILTGVVIAIGVLIPFSPLGASVGLKALPPSYFLWLVATLVAYCALTQIIKTIYVRRFKKWL